MGHLCSGVQQSTENRALPGIYVLLKASSLPRAKGSPLKSKGMSKPFAMFFFVCLQDDLKASRDCCGLCSIMERKWVHPNSMM